jgi:hypothetical protein
LVVMATVGRLVRRSGAVVVRMPLMRLLNFLD